MALHWPAPDPLIEAGGDGPAKRAQRAFRAAKEIVLDQRANERALMAQLLNRLATLKRALQSRLLAEDGSLTDFRAFSLRSTLADVERLIADAQTAIVNDTERQYLAAAHLGAQAADLPLAAAQLPLPSGLTVGIDRALVHAAFGNTVDLLTQPMQQFATAVKVAVRRVALAGDDKYAALTTLRDTIAGQGFDNAQFAAERIIRTELGRVFNDATFSRLQQSADAFPFLRKAWRATNDSRTRLGHVEAADTYGKGSGIPLDELFKINVYQELRKHGAVVGYKQLGVASLRFPLDPSATPGGRIAAGATIMCRCHAFIDFDLADFGEYTRTKVQTAFSGAAA